MGYKKTIISQRVINYITTVGGEIERLINSGLFEKCNLFSAFTGASAVRWATSIIPKSLTVNFFTGVDLNSTSKEALEELMNLTDNSYIYYEDNNKTYHMKLYIFEGKNDIAILEGSSNFTKSGLFESMEHCTLHEYTNNDPAGIEHLNQLYENYAKFLNFSDPNLRKITPPTIDNFVNDGIVPLTITYNQQKNKRKKNKKRVNSPNRNIITNIPQSFKDANPTKSTSFAPKTPTKTYTKTPAKTSTKTYANIPTITSTFSLGGYDENTYLHTESSYHFPQGVHIGHILYALKIIKDNAISGSYLDDKYVRLRGNFDSGSLGGFQRKLKYLLVAIMEMGIIEDNRNLTDQSNFKITLTKKGKTLTKMITPFLDVANLNFKPRSGSTPSWEMESNKKDYVYLLKTIINSSSENLLFWQDLIQFPAVIFMEELIKTSSVKEVSKNDFIYPSFNSFEPIKSFCKSLKIRHGSIEAAKHRCPFLLDLLEIGSMVEQKHKFVSLI